MSRRDPPSIGNREAGTRRQRIGRTARSLGFRGRVEYRHVYSQTGGAQFCLGPSMDADLLVVYAEAFERDRDPEDFSLEAVIAHECGHQRLLRDRTLVAIGHRLAGGLYEEVLASLLGSLLVGKSRDAEHFMIGKKKLSEVRRELTELLEQLPKEPAGSWIERELQTAAGQAERDVETLDMLRSALKQAGKKKRPVSAPS